MQWLKWEAGTSFNRRDFLIGAAASVAAPYGVRAAYAQTLTSLGWNFSQSPTQQREVIQGALSAGPCVLEFPFSETIQIDQGLIAPFPVHLFGHGSDITNTASALSQIRCATPNQTILQLLASNSVVENINFHSDAANTSGYGVLVGDGGANQPSGIHLSRITTGSNCWRGVGIVSGQELTVDNSFLNAQDAAFVSDNENSDEGDNRIMGGEMNAYGSENACVRLFSGGGLIIGGGSKLLDCWNHIAMAWHKGGSGGLLVEGGVSMENCTSTVSCDLDGSQPFNRIAFKGVSWGNGATCIAVRSSHSVKWLQQISILGNMMAIGGPASLSAVDLDYCDEALVRGNNINGGGYAYTGIITRANCTGNVDANIVRGITGQYPAFLNESGSGVTGSPNQL